MAAAVTATAIGVATAAAVLGIIRGLYGSRHHPRCEMSGEDGGGATATAIETAAAAAPG